MCIYKNHRFNGGYGNWVWERAAWHGWRGRFKMTDLDRILGTGFGIQLHGIRQGVQALAGLWPGYYRLGSEGGRE
jgi:hypothetical protein